MLRPDEYELKKWLCNNIVIGLRIEYREVTSDTTVTDWVLTTVYGVAKRVSSRAIRPLVTVHPDLVSVLHVLPTVRHEVEEYDKFVRKEQSDFATYKRLKAKFEGV